MPTERDHAALARVAVDLEIPEWQRADSLDERGLVARRDQFWLIAETFGELRVAFGAMSSLSKNSN